MPIIKNFLASLLRRLNLLSPEIVRYNDLKAYPMVNSITLSSDMSTLYLIDNGRAISFPLGKEKMILVGLIKGQVTVATSLAPGEKVDEPAPGPENPDPLSSGELLRGGSGGGVGVVKVPVTPKSQWTLFFNPGQQVMALIGAVEIDPGLNPDKPEPIDTDIFLFNLNDLVVGINLIGNALVFTPLRRGR
ncbi:MAG: hypothetical protein H6573_24310 [Lewinellaceae bacterium]|nr:hypothetical protein [Phaeodactylibacter sp.]MCB9350607.1 hypothetical protein [Lewinellaceae bacterium]